MAMSDLGYTFAAAMLDAAQEAMTAAELDIPALVMTAAGTGVPTSDGCDGMLWCRLVTQMPSPGDAGQFTEVRWDWDVPAWCYVLELGFMFCHPVIKEDGTSPDPDVWSQMAYRDAQYRMALFNAAAYLYPDKVRHCAGGQRLEPYAPIGPEGGYSGGLIVSYTVANFLAQ